MRILIIALVLLLTSTSSFAQNWVGKSKWQVLRYLEKNFKYIDSAKYRLNVTTYTVADLENMDISITYDFKDTICTTMTYAVPNLDKPKILKAFKDNKELVWSAKDETWYNYKKKYKWYFVIEDDRPYTDYVCITF